jgi:hypothetical protein
LKFKIYIHRIEQGLNIAWRMYIYIWQRKAMPQQLHQFPTKRGDIS